jgi:uncharacterized protein
MTLSQLDGFLTGIALSPEPVMLNEWMPLVFGEDNPVLQNVEEMRTVFGTLLSRYGEIISGLRQEPPQFEPVFGKTAASRSIAADWAGGFLDAMALRGAAWMPLLRRTEGRLLLTPIVLSLPEDEVPTPAGFEFVRDPEMLAEVTELIPDAVIEIDRFWRRRRTQPRKRPRNARCPCGSGRKYKFCCGR